MADYNANIKVNADTRQAESQLKKLQSSLDKLSNFSSKINLQNTQREFNKLGTTLRGIGERGALGALTLGAGKATAAIGGLGAKFGIVGAAAASAGTAINTALGGVPGVVTDILSQVGNIPNAFGLAAVAAMAFAPQILKASAATVGLGAAIDKAVGKETTEKIADIVGNVGLLNTEINTVKTSFASLIQGSTLNQLNAQLRDAVEQTGAFHSSTTEAVTAAQQLVTVTKAQAAEQRAINDLVRKAKGITQTELQEAKAIKTLKTRKAAQELYNVEIDEYNRLAREAAEVTKQWDRSLRAVNTSAKAGVLGSSNQIRARLQELRENRRSADIARQQSAAVLGRKTIGTPGIAGFEVLPTSGPLQGPGALGDVARAEANRIALRKQSIQLLEQERRKAQQNLQLMSNWTKVLSQGVGLQGLSARLRKQELQDRKDAFTVANRELQFELKLQAIQEKRAAAQRAVTEGRTAASRRSGAASNALIGGAFPLLFGQGAGAALGGALGGAAGGLLGGTFGFALSLVGTAIGQALAEAEKFNTELAVLNARTKQLGADSQTTAKDVEQLAKNLGIAKDEAFKVLSAYAGFDSAKTRNALAVLYGDDSALLGSLAAAKDQASLAQIILGTYNKIGIERATQLIDQLKSGDLASVELAFQKALLDVEMEKTRERLRQVTLQDRIVAGLASIGSVQGGGKFIDPEVFGEERVRKFEEENKPSEIFTRALEGLRKLQAATRTAESFNDKAGRKAADRAAKNTAAADDLTKRLQRQLELATAKTEQDKKALRILFEYEDNIEAIRKLEDQSQAARQSKIADELYSLELTRLATDELTKYLNTLISIAAVSPGLGRQAFQGTALQGSLQTDVGLAFGTQETFAAVSPEEKTLNEAKKRLEELVNPINMVQTAAQGIGNAFNDSFKSIIDGTATTQEALANLFNRIADAFFDMAAQIITQMLVIKAVESAIQIFGGGGVFKGFSGAGPAAFPSDLNIPFTIPGRAVGGPVSAGSPYVVGERGPELFVPGRSGTIIPNDKMGGSRVEVGTINISVENTGEQLSPAAQKQIANQVQGIVMSTLVNERRSGGVLR